MASREIQPFPPHHPLHDDVPKMEGKTIKRVEYGNLPNRQEVHQSEIIVIHFTNGESVELTIGTNLAEFRDRMGIKCRDVKADFILDWESRI